MMKSSWMLELEHDARWLVETVASAERTLGLACGKDYDLLLLRGDRVLSYTVDATGQTETISQLGEIDGDLSARIASFLYAPSHDVAALVLPAQKRALLLLPAAGATGGASGLLAKVPDGISCLLATSETVFRASASRSYPWDPLVRRVSRPFILRSVFSSMMPPGLSLKAIMIIASLGILA
jgi:hypothetical protein